jgi:hypothetical protein
MNQDFGLTKKELKILRERNKDELNFIELLNNSQIFFEEIGIWGLFFYIKEELVYYNSILQQYG